MAAIFNALLEKPQQLFRKPLFWALFTALSIACAFTAYHYFPTAFPLVNINIKMDRTQALEQARALAVQHGWGPTTPQQAVSFNADTKVQHFVELEGGGNKAFIAMLKDNLYQAYTWHVRHFQERNPHEVTIIFTPEGQPYGFNEKLPEDQPGNNISSQQAQAMVEQQASNWYINLSEYQLVERSQEEKTGKRIDHQLVYERPTPTIGEGTYRIQFTVSGDKLTEVNPLVKVPESFVRSYEHMRSRNNSIATAAIFFMFVFYIAILCSAGTVYLMKKDALSLRMAILWAFVLAALQALTSFNNLPLKWMRYNTAVSKLVFIGTLSNGILFGFLTTAIMYLLIFVAAEGLTRLAFGNQVQLWRVWASHVGNSFTIMGYTLAGYLLVPFLPLYVVATYFTTRTFFGWWTPSEVLIDPNVLATYMPWLNAIGNSLNAGFMEECLFRAVPLATAVLVGRYFKREKSFLILAFIAQALIFGAGHAHYPAQPAYARLVELILPSFIFGFIYLAFGLLTGILVHFFYDVIWYALPIFVSSGMNAYLNQLIIITLCAIPLLMVLYRTYQYGLELLPTDALNATWQPEPTTQEHSLFASTQHITLPSSLVTTICITTALAMVGWCLLRPWTIDSERLQPNRAQAITLARTALTKLQVTLSSEWEALATIKDAVEPADRFIWQEGGKKLYEQLRNSYLKSPRWVIRFVNFNAPAADRAEEYDVVITDNGTIERIIHKLPEARAGADLSEEEARTLALATLKNLYQLEQPAIEPVSAVATKQPHRKDWTFTYQYPAVLPLSQGQARLVVVVSGDQVTDAARYIYPPQEWTREDQNKTGLLALIKQIFLLALIIILAFSSSFFINEHRSMDSRWVLYAIATLLLIKVVSFINMLPASMGHFQTSVPKMTQIFLLVGQWIPATIMQTCGIGLLMGILIHVSPRRCITNNSKMRLGIALGSLSAIVCTLIRQLLYTTTPFFGIYREYAYYSTVLTILTDMLSLVATIGVVFWMIGACLQTNRLLLGVKVGIMGACGFLAGGLLYNADTVTTLLAVGTCFAIMLMVSYYLVLQYHPSIAIPFFTGLFCMQLLNNSIAQPYPTALISGVLAIGCVLGLLSYLFRRCAQIKPC